MTTLAINVLVAKLEKHRNRIGTGLGPTMLITIVTGRHQARSTEQ